eukprot:scaffold54285_cov103-Phaeocystis_antarctica.AAC.2
MGAAHREHARLRGARRESLRVIQVACAEAQCAQRRARTRARTSPRSPALKWLSVSFLSVCSNGGGGISRRQQKA